jgi:DNA-directed RNA polymerase II subunit RPB1
MRASAAECNSRASGLCPSHSMPADAAAPSPPASPWVLRFEFDRAKMLELQVTMLDLENALADWYDDRVDAVFSDDNSKDLLCRLRLVLADGEAPQDTLTELKALEQSILEKVYIKGVAGVHRAAAEPQPAALLFYDEETDAFTRREEVRISTNGTNLSRVLAHSAVDSTLTRSNDVQEVYDVLGIEAARACLLDQLRTVMCCDDVNNVNYRHMALLVDVMTNRGFLQSIDRHGINRGEIGPLAKCSFEETTDMLVKAGVFAELDRINGVSANIMLGQVAPCGTGDCEILLDDRRLAELDDAPLPASQQKEQSARPGPAGPGGPGGPGGPRAPVQPFVAPVADARLVQQQADEIELVE